MSDENAAALELLIRVNADFMLYLRAARDCVLPDWFIGAGAVRNLVWDHLHGYTPPTPLKDVDVIFFDSSDLRPERDVKAQAELEARLPGVPWEATNQAAVHLWYADSFGYTVPPLVSSTDAIGTWPETATCVGVRLLPDDSLIIVAPFGLDDLFHLILRRNPRRVSLAEFHKRMRDKKIVQTWPRVSVIDG